jgi:telomere length regulation protein
MFLLALSLFRPYDPFIVSLSHRPEFLMAVQAFLSHPDPKVRRLGMLVAEILSERTIMEVASSNGHVQTEEEEMAELQAGFEAQEGSEGSGKPPRTTKGPKRLKFDKGMWDGEGEGKEECRWLRRCVGVNDLSVGVEEDPTGKGWMLGWDQLELEEQYTAPPAPTPTRGRQHTTKQAPTKSKTKPPKAKPKIVMLDEAQQADPLEGYLPESPTSSRSPSPTPSYLEEVAADPTLALDATQSKKVSRPVYVPQLIVLLKEREKPDHIEMGLKWGEGLVRAKRSFGTELCELHLHIDRVGRRLTRKRKMQ